LLILQTKYYHGRLTGFVLLSSVTRSCPAGACVSFSGCDWDIRCGEDALTPCILLFTQSMPLHHLVGAFAQGFDKKGKFGDVHLGIPSPFPALALDICDAFKLTSSAELSTLSNPAGGLSQGAMPSAIFAL